MSKEKKAKKMRVKRTPTFLESLIPIIAMLLILTIGKGVLGFATEPLLILVACVAAIIAFRVGCTWDEMMDEICQKIAKGMPAILILITVGAMVGTWMSSGTIPMMIYYGVQIVSPRFLLVTAFLITAVVSVVTGTSWGSVATMGVALMGIAEALGVSLPATAGGGVGGGRLLRAVISVTRCHLCPIPRTWLPWLRAASSMSTSAICFTRPFPPRLFPWSCMRSWGSMRMSVPA